MTRYNIRYFSHLKIVSCLAKPMHVSSQLKIRILLRMSLINTWFIQNKGVVEGFQDIIKKMTDDEYSEIDVMKKITKIWYHCCQLSILCGKPVLRQKFV